MSILILWLLNSLQQISPSYSPSPMIASVTFAPRTQIIIKAQGSDNWPITWGDDNCLYTAYGDGWGFKPFTDVKLSLGFAKVIGMPPHFRGVNIRSPTGERFGDGPRGAKASGMLMVDGVLYMWVRNVSNSMLAWSEDHGKTWRYGFRFNVSFGHPTFLNFGRNYEGARDDYVYVYSPDGPSAYESYDGIILARVPKRKIKDRSAYEFFQGFDAHGKPLWTRNINQRGHVFTLPNRCARLDVIYNRGIKRYLMALGFNHKGGWGLFDAPEPWGPWTVAFFTERWDCGDTHSYRIPTKWISADGTTMHLIFSGKGKYDAFCTRKMILKLKR
ncbi:MAG TPA: DUF4185 domain-containing protein [Armatimonadetes bacterium]|nr:DUF4185 domain-containing protein [Armatimonadota bacterium]